MSSLAQSSRLVAVFCHWQASIYTLWLTKFVAHTLPSRETAQNLRNHNGTPVRSGMKRKRRNEPATAKLVDPDLWIQDAHAANDDEAVAWLVRMRESNMTQEQAQKRRHLDVDARRWEQYQTASDRLAQEHAQRAYDTYQSAHAAEVTRWRLCKLHALYSNTLIAKTNHHLLVAKLIQEHMAAQRLHCTHTNMCQVRRQWYEQAKHDTVTWYADAKTSLLSYKRYEEMCTDHQAAGPPPTAGTLHVAPTGAHRELDTGVQ